ncbi:MAG: MoaD/ThiS family protein [Candidatus Hadarchaeota archaeon]
MVEVRLIGRTPEAVRVDGDRKISEILASLGVSRETVVVSLNGKIVPEEETAKEGDRLEVLPVVTGG